MKPLAITVLVLVGTGSLVSCANELDVTRNERPSLSIGEEVFNEFCSRVAREELPLDVTGAQTRPTCMFGVEPRVDSLRLNVLHQNRSRLVQAIDFGILFRIQFFWFFQFGDFL